MHTVLETDSYKFSMQDAGFPLRRETFYYGHRKGGPMIVPLDIPEFVAGLLPAATKEDYEYLAKNEYEMGVGFKSVFGPLPNMQVNALPKYSIFYPGEPVFSVTGPSALVSWFEPLVLQLHFRFQIATLGLLDPEGLVRELSQVTCHRQADIAAETLDAVGVKSPKMDIDDGGYFTRVLANAKAAIWEVGDPDRLFEVGFRSASCLEQHAVALRAVKEAGIARTSNAELARQLFMKPVGTMGHEHPQRFRGDEPAFRAMRDRRPYRSSYLTDTYNALNSGIPAAIKLMMECPGRQDSMRYDSKNKMTDYVFAAAMAKEKGLEPIHIVESELDAKEIKAFEDLRKSLAIPLGRQFYGLGGYFVSQPAPGKLSRDTVAAIYKLSQTGPWPTMKFSEEKESLPGKPVVFRRRSGEGPSGIVGQEGEKAPEGYSLETGIGKALSADRDSDNARRLEEASNQEYPHAELSKATQGLRDEVRREYQRIEKEAFFR